MSACLALLFLTTSPVMQASAAPAAADADSGAAQPLSVADAGPEFTYGLQVRPRWESAVPGNIGMAPDGTNFRITQRTRASVGFEWSMVSAFVSVQDVRTWASETSTLTDFSADNIDFHEGYGELAWEGFGLRIGRQELTLDGQRLIGPVNWAQQARTFDGLKLTYARKDAFDITAFYSRVADGGLHDLYIADGKVKLGDISVSVPLILQTNLGVKSSDRGPRLADWTRVTGGAYVRGGGDLDWRVEAYLQGGNNTFSHLLAGRVGYRFSDVIHPQVWIDYLSGDSNNSATDNFTETFDTLFATNHKFYGFMDRFINLPAHTKGGGLIDLALKQTGKAGPGKLHAAVHFFVIPSTDSDGNDGPLGLEFDAVYTVPLHEIVKAQGGYGLFVDLGDYALGREHSVHNWFFVQVILSI